MKKKLLFRIRIFVNISFNIVVILTGMLICAGIFFYVRDLLRSNLYTRLHDLTYSVSKVIDGDSFEMITSKDDPLSRELYGKIQIRLQELQKNSTRIFYIYTLRLDAKGTPVFSVIHDDDKGFMGYFNEPLLDFPKQAIPLFSNAGVEVKKDFYTDQYGTWVSGFASIVNSQNKVVGVVGVDVAADDVISNEMKVLIIIGLITLVTILLVTFLSLKFSKMITKPLIQIEDEMKQIRKFELADPTPVKTIFIELLSMENTVKNTIQALRSFKRYVPAELVQQIVTTEREAVLSGEKTEATFLFTDIAGFTSITETVTIELLVQKLGLYFKGMISTIHSCKGTVDKYIGDAVMAFWGAPNPVANHHYHACEAALKCLDFLKEFNDALEKEGFPRLDTRFGIHAGNAIIGNMGYIDRLNYTAIGDSVNTASRLEGLNKHYRTSILISESVYDNVKEHFVARLLDRIIVKGKTTSIAIYELIDFRERADLDSVVTYAEQYTAAMNLYYSREWKEAERILRHILPAKPEDIQLKRMINLCTTLRKDPPEDEWNGVIQFKFK